MFSTVGTLSDPVRPRPRCDSIENGRTQPSRGHDSEQCQNTNIFFSITQWGSKPHKIINENIQLADVFAFTETHIPAAGFAK
eukprot:2141399-Pyramimonas_sp.AAC.1